ncbi:hypothetical protein Tco_1511593, partial [Tanacetum coccineum]
RPQLVPTGKPKVPAPVPTGRQHRPIPVPTGRQNRPIPVPTGRQNRPSPVPTGRQNKPSPVPTGRGDSPSVTSGWWKSTARPMPHLNRLTSSYFQTYTPYLPQIWATAVKPSAGCSWKTHRKGLYWENSYTDVEDEGIFNSGCARSMTGNMERLDDFQEFQGGKVTFGGGEGRITGKETIRNPTLDFENVYYDFKLLDDSMVLLRVPRKHNLYTINLNNLSPKGNLACTQDANSDSECDEQVIIIPSYPSHIIQEAAHKDISSDEVDDTPLDSAEEFFQKELARLKGQEQRATSVAKDTEEFQKRASTKSVPPGSIPVPTGSIQILSGVTTISPGSVPVPTGCPTDSFFNNEPTIRFPSPSDLGNNEPSLGIFSSSSYDDEFGADLNNLASTVEVSPVATKRINTIHP